MDRARLLFRNDDVRSALKRAVLRGVDLRLLLVDPASKPGHGKKRRAIVPLNPEVLQALKAAKELACSDSIVEFHGRPLKTVKKGFREACKRAGLVGVTPHILRHSGATWMTADGVPLSEVARMLGDTEATVERVYTT